VAICNALVTSLFIETRGFFCFLFSKRSPEDATRKTEVVLHKLFLKNEEQTREKNLNERMYETCKTLLHTPRNGFFSEQYKYNKNTIKYNKQTI